MNTKSINIGSILRPILLFAIGLAIGLIIGLGIAGKDNAPTSFDQRRAVEPDRQTARRTVSLRVSGERLTLSDAPDVASLGRVRLKVEGVDSFDVLDEGRLV